MAVFTPTLEIRSLVERMCEHLDTPSIKYFPKGFISHWNDTVTAPNPIKSVDFVNYQWVKDANVGVDISQSHLGYFPTVTIFAPHKVEANNNTITCSRIA